MEKPDFSQTDKWDVEDWQTFAVRLSKAQAAAAFAPMGLSETLDVLQLIQSNVRGASLPHRVYLSEMADTLIDLAVGALQRLKNDIRETARNPELYLDD